ncbi:hypothetical protein L484_020595 [Morus notabilis]|uniref:Spastin/Vps4 C-terminal domain-containing protein n=1 Tax=Morus notabilis TaxID=981085 RepID=W9S922_9ROSA|nr:hypothetical protein L484_020595 [Morus notabilis]
MCDKAESSNSKKDFSTAILERKKAPSRLVVDEAVNDDNSVVAMHPATMEKLQIFRGDTILIKSRLAIFVLLILFIMMGLSGAIDEDVEVEVSEIKAAHFEESMKHARRSVSDADILKYQAFAQTLQQSRGFGSEFKFSSASQTGASGSDPFATSAGAADDEDFYS